MTKPERSFTLVEAILTIVIMGILVAVVLPRFGMDLVSTSKLRSASSQSAADIRYTRQLAITNSSHYLIKFDFTQKEYKIYRDSISAANQVGETKKISSDISLSGADQFDFYALGNCPACSASLTLSLGAAQYNIRVEPPTGAVVIE